MINAGDIKEHAEVVGADGRHVGTVDRIENGRIKLTRKDNPASHQDHHHFIDLDQVESVDADRVRLSVNAEVAVGSEQEDDGSRVQ